jgi:uncharacterized protein YcnI
MRRSAALTGLLIAALLTPTGVTAQVNVRPLSIAPGVWERLSLQVANPLDSPIVAIRVEIPPDIVVAGVEPRPEWPFQVDSLSDGGQAIEWRGGWVAQGELQEFGFLARLRSDTDSDRVALPVHLTRVGGRVESLAPRLFVDRTPKLTSQGTAMLGVIALVVSVIALAIAIVARVGRRLPSA